MHQSLSSPMSCISTANNDYYLPRETRFLPILALGWALLLGQHCRRHQNWREDRTQRTGRQFWNLLVLA